MPGTRPGMTKERTVRLFPSPDIGPFGRRQRHVRGHRIPVTVTRKASASDGDRTVIDTFGADDVAPLPGGCTCCTVRPKLQTALLGLLADREQKPFSCIAVESSEDLGAILRTFADARALGGECYVEGAPPLDGDRFTLTEDALLSWTAVGRFVTTISALRGTDLLQMTGLLNVAGCRGPVAVQVIGHLAARPVELQTWPDGKCVSRLEFVTHGFDTVSVRAMFDAVRAL
jgi:G3E family GTPase